MAGLSSLALGYRVGSCKIAASHLARGFARLTSTNKEKNLEDEIDRQIGKKAVEAMKIAELKKSLLNDPYDEKSYIELLKVIIEVNIDLQL